MSAFLVFSVAHSRDRCVLSTILRSFRPLYFLFGEVGTRKEKGNSMTYQKPIDILTSGNTLWNAWRQTYPDVQAFEPDLHAADLHQAQLHGIDFHDTDLTEADLQQADLRGADLREADLRHANLRGSDLSDAHLQKARLRGADLREAKLCRAQLTKADLSHADLRGADLSGADLTKALLDQTQFDEAKAFAEGRHTHLKAKEPERENVTIPAAAA